MHFFFKEIAKEYGLRCAIMLNHIIYWIANNSSKNHNYHDGRTWTYCSVSKFKKYFPYWTDSQIRRILLKLVQCDILIEGNYNKIKYDRTKWYALKDEQYWLENYNPIDRMKEWNNKY